jgi:phosphate transport system protein
MDAFARRDAALGRAVCQRDDEVDQLYQQVFRELLSFLVDDPRVVRRALNLLFAAHNLERIGDRITNIGERVIYAATGKLEELNVQKPAG